MNEAYFIVYVSDQGRSASYYCKVLALEPILDVPGITEFRLLDGAILGVMSVESAARLIGDRHFAAADSQRTPKAELYLVVDDPSSYHRRAIECGGTELSPMQLRSWGHRAAYSLDQDGHVLAFAEKVAPETSA